MKHIRFKSLEDLFAFLSACEAGEALGERRERQLYDRVNIVSAPQTREISYHVGFDNGWDGSGNLYGGEVREGQAPGKAATVNDIFYSILVCSSVMTKLAEPNIVLAVPSPGKTKEVELRDQLLKATRMVPKLEGARCRYFLRRFKADEEKKRPRICGVEIMDVDLDQFDYAHFQAKAPPSVKLFLPAWSRARCHLYVEWGYRYPKAAEFYRLFDEGAAAGKNALLLVSKGAALAGPGGANWHEPHWHLISALSHEERHHAFATMGWEVAPSIQNYDDPVSCAVPPITLNLGPAAESVGESNKLEREIGLLERELEYLQAQRDRVNQTAHKDFQPIFVWEQTGLPGTGPMPRSLDEFLVRAHGDLSSYKYLAIARANELTWHCLVGQAPMKAGACLAVPCDRLYLRESRWAEWQLPLFIRSDCSLEIDVDETRVADRLITLLRDEGADDRKHLILAEAAEAPGSAFAAGEFRDVAAFVQLYAQHGRNVDHWLDEHLPRVGEALSANEGGLLQSPQLQDMLAQDLNDIVNGECIFELERFRDVGLRETTKYLASQELQGEDLKRLNRMLLEDAYPLGLTRKLRLQFLLLPNDKAQSLVESLRYITGFGQGAAGTAVLARALTLESVSNQSIAAPAKVSELDGLLQVRARELVGEVQGHWEQLRMDCLKNRIEMILTQVAIHATRNAYQQHPAAWNEFVDNVLKTDELLARCKIEALGRWEAEIGRRNQTIADIGQRRKKAAEEIAKQASDFNAMAAELDQKLTATEASLQQLREARDRLDTSRERLGEANRKLQEKLMEVNRQIQDFVNQRDAYVAEQKRLKAAAELAQKKQVEAQEALEELKRAQQRLKEEEAKLAAEQARLAALKAIVESMNLPQAHAELRVKLTEVEREAKELTAQRDAFQADRQKLLDATQLARSTRTEVQEASNALDQAAKVLPAEEAKLAKEQADLQKKQTALAALQAKSAARRAEFDGLKAQAANAAALQEEQWQALAQEKARFCSQPLPTRPRGFFERIKSLWS